MKRAESSSDSIFTSPAEEATRTVEAGGTIFTRSLISGRNPEFARFLLAALILLAVSSSVVRAQEDPAPTAQTVTTSETPAETTAEESSAEDIVWPPPFNPSEEIGADSQVSFPTDI